VAGTICGATPVEAIARAPLKYLPIRLKPSSACVEGYFMAKTGPSTKTAPPPAWTCLSSAAAISSVIM